MGGTVCMIPSLSMLSGESQDSPGTVMEVSKLRQGGRRPIYDCSS